MVDTLEAEGMSEDAEIMKMKVSVEPRHESVVDGQVVPAHVRLWVRGQLGDDVAAIPVPLSPEMARGLAGALLSVAGEVDPVGHQRVVAEGQDALDLFRALTDLDLSQFKFN